MKKPLLESFKAWFPYIGGAIFAILLISAGYNWIMAILVSLIIAGVVDYNIKKAQGGTPTNVAKENQGTTSTSRN